VIPRYLNSVTSAVVHEGGNCISIPAEEDHDFCFVIVLFSEPFEMSIVIEFVQLELLAFSRV
jgi:hypothetical protein